MDFNEYQEKAKETDLYPPDSIDIFSEFTKLHLLEYRALCLAGEIGELCNFIKKIRRDRDRKIDEEVVEHVIQELGGAQWYMSTICTILDIPYSKVAEENIKTLFDRKEHDAIRGTGHDRVKHGPAIVSSYSLESLRDKVLEFISGKDFVDTTSIVSEFYDSYDFKFIHETIDDLVYDGYLKWVEEDMLVVIGDTND